VLSLHIYQTNFTNESRIVKETRTLIESGVVDECVVLAMGDRGLSPTETFSPGCRVIRLPILTRELVPARWMRPSHVLEWMGRVVSAAGRLRPDVVQAHSIACLPMAVWLKRAHGARIVYDAHELETESASAKGIKKPAVKALERALIGYADEVLVVSDSIAEWYRQHYPLNKITVVRNVPEVRDTGAAPVVDRAFRRQLGIPEDALLFLYQGLLGRGRGIELTLEAFAGQDSNKHVVFLGYGPLEELIRVAAHSSPNIHFAPAVPPERVLEVTRNADVGLAVIEDICLSYRYCLPNKLFEYVMAGVPVIASDFPDMGQVIDRQRCGWRTAVNVSALRALVAGIDRAAIDRKRREMQAEPLHFGWHLEAKELVSVYQRLRDG
jgi:glycosyltransferase involved in cell wall biosynthesis